MVDGHVFHNFDFEIGFHPKKPTLYVANIFSVMARNKFIALEFIQILSFSCPGQELIKSIMQNL